MASERGADMSKMMGANTGRIGMPWIGWLAMACVALAGTAQAQAPNMNDMIKDQLSNIPTGEAGVEQILAPMEERLELSAEQKAEIKPVVTEMVADFESARAKFESGEYTVMKMMMELNMKGEAAAAKVEPMLNEKQLAEYQTMRKEQKREAQLLRQKAMREMMEMRQEKAELKTEVEVKVEGK